MDVNELWLNNKAAWGDERLSLLTDSLHMHD